MIFRPENAKDKSGLNRMQPYVRIQSDGKRKARFDYVIERVPCDSAGQSESEVRYVCG